MTRRGLLITGLPLALAAACASADLPEGIGGDLFGTPAARIVLIGDAGDVDGGAEVLPALSGQLERHAARTSVVFLGDNVYPNGVPAGCDDLSCDEARALHNQLSLASLAGGLKLFVPGNHDWGDNGFWVPDPADGVRRLERQEVLVRESGAEFLPEPSCPGPATRELAGGLVRLIAIDSQWWLFEQSEREAAAWRGPCEGLDEDDVLAALEAALVCTSEPCPINIVASHHPLFTYGPHGGKFPGYTHATPPLFGSLYVGARRSGVTHQDVSGTPYAHYIERVGAVISRHRPLAFASGHEHALQLIQPGDGVTYVVSGSGSKTSYATEGPGTQFVYAGPGAIVIDVFGPDAVLARVVAVTGEGDEPREAKDVFFRWLRRGPPSPIVGAP